MANIALSSDQTPTLQPGRLELLLRYLRRNKGLAVGLVILLALTLFTVIGLLVVNPKSAYPLSAALKQPPSLKFPFGTDFFGRNLLAAMVLGMWQTAAIGLLAGGIGTLIGVLPGLGPVATIAMLLPATFTLPPLGGLGRRQLSPRNRLQFDKFQGNKPDRRQGLLSNDAADRHAWDRPSP